MSWRRHRVSGWVWGLLVLAILLMLARYCLRDLSPFRSGGQVHPSAPISVREANPRPAQELERLVFLFSNQARQRQGLAPLRGDADLAAVARAHSQDMLQRGYFEHVTPEGLTQERRIHREHRTLVGTTGENLWTGSGYPPGDLPALARGIVEDWLHSPGHRENLLRPEFTHLGVGIATALGGEIRATQNFATVRAFLRRSLPEEISRGEHLLVSASDFELVDSGSGAPCFLGFRAEAGKTPKRFPLGTLQSPRATGSYQLVVYFPTSEVSRYLLVPGPEVEIR